MQQARGFTLSARDCMASVGFDVHYIDSRAGHGSVPLAILAPLAQWAHLAPEVPIVLWTTRGTKVPETVLAALGKDGSHLLLPAHFGEGARAAFRGKSHALAHSKYPYALHLDLDSWPCARSIALLQSLQGTADVVWSAAPRFPCGGIQGGRCGLHVSAELDLDPELQLFRQFRERNTGTLLLTRRSPTVLAWLAAVDRIYSRHLAGGVPLYHGIAEQPAWREATFLWRHNLTERLLPSAQACRHSAGVAHNDSPCGCLCECSDCTFVHDQLPFQQCCENASTSLGFPPSVCGAT